MIRRYLWIIEATRHLSYINYNHIYFFYSDPRGCSRSISIAIQTVAGRRDGHDIAPSGQANTVSISHVRSQSCLLNMTTVFAYVY